MLTDAYENVTPFEVVIKFWHIPWANLLLLRYSLDAINFIFYENINNVLLVGYSVGYEFNFLQ